MAPPTASCTSPTAAVQQRAQNAPHMRVVVDDQKAQPIEIDTDHANSRAEDAETHLRTVKR
jgi:hypothetical protein